MLFLKNHAYLYLFFLTGFKSMKSKKKAMQQLCCMAFQYHEVLTNCLLPAAPLFSSYRWQLSKIRHGGFVLFHL